MTKLHEILAVEGDLANTWKKVAEEATATFGKKPEHFIETVKSLEMLRAEDKHEEGSETKAMVTTVGDKLSYLAEHASRYVDAVYQKEKTNQIATADLEVDGRVYLTAAPATFLLGMEARLVALRQMCEQIPTLQPGKVWVLDTAKGKGVYRSEHPEVRQKTKKEIQHKVLVPSTEHHPAQVEKWVADVAVGKYTEHQWSGMLSPAEKSDLLGRVDKWLRAVKRARQRANTAEVKKEKVAKAIFDNIFFGV